MKLVVRRRGLLSAGLFEHGGMNDARGDGRDSAEQCQKSGHVRWVKV